ncbi:hypothetical protein AKJ16_DCAP18265 [Drosera capensis]
MVIYSSQYGTTIAVALHSVQSNKSGVVSSSFSSAATPRRDHGPFLSDLGIIRFLNSSASNRVSVRL